MQSAFAYEIAKQAQLEMLAAEFDQFFAPDLMSMEPQDKNLLASKSKKAKKLFFESVHKKSLLYSEGDEIDGIVLQKIKNFHNKKQDLISSIKHNIVIDIASLRKKFLFLLSIPSYISERIKYREDKERSMKVGTIGFLLSEYNIEKNPYFDAITKNEKLKSALENYKIEKPDSLLIRSIYEDLLKNEEYKSYLQKKDKDDETELKSIKKLFKIVFKNEAFLELFEGNDLNWLENSEILKGLCLMMFKKEISEISTDDFFTEIINSDDNDFWQKLFIETNDDNKYVASIITNKLKNWELERVSMTDRIILKMAIQEMLNHPSIPLKVTMNEYVELSKKFSTPKSKQFVNGVLDNVSKELAEQGKIRKSGRGLIDNK